MAGRFSVETVFKGVDRVTRPVKRMQRGVARFTRSVENRFRKAGRAVSNFNRRVKSGALAGSAALVAFGAAAVNVISVGAEFGRAIGAAAAKFPDKIKRGTEAFIALKKAAREVGATTEFTATQAAEGLNFLAKAGFDAKFSVSVLKDIVDFATASELEFAEAADIASDAIGAFGLDSKDPAKKLANINRVMDVMSKTANSTNVSVAELFETVVKGAPVAVKAGQSIETFAAVAGVLAGVGIKASEAGTATKNIALALAGVGNKAAKTFKKLNIPLTTADGKLRDVADVFEDLNKATSKMDEDELLGVMNAIFGKISLAAATNLLGDGADKIRVLRKTLEDAGGSSKRTAAFIRNDVKGSIDGLSSAIDGVKISIFDMNEGSLKDVIDSMTEWVRANEAFIATKIGDFIKKIFDNLDVIIEWVKAIAKFMAGMVLLNVTLNVFTGVMTAVNLVMAANPIVLITLAVLAFAAAAVFVVMNWEKVKTFFTDLWSELPIGAQIAFKALGAAFIAPIALIMAAWEPLKTFFEGLWAKIQSIVDLAKNIKLPSFLGGDSGLAIAGAGAGAGFLPGAGLGAGFLQGARDMLPSFLGGSTSEPAEVMDANGGVMGQPSKAEASVTGEITIRDDTGRAEVTKENTDPSVSINVEKTGGF